MTVLLAVDIGGTKVAARSSAATESAVVTRTWPAKSDREADLDLVFEVAGQALRAAGAERPQVAVVAFPGSLNPAGRVQRWPVRPDWAGLDLLDVLTDRWDCRPQVHDDALLAGYAEATTLAASGTRPDGLLYLGLGTGVGGAYTPVRPGPPDRPLCPEDLRAHELGHVVVHPDSDRRCDCGRPGCLQAYASGRAVHRRSAEVGRSAALAEAADACALAVANSAELQPVHSVVLGGGLAAASAELPELLAGQIRRRMRAGTPVPRVRPAAHGAGSSLEGARLTAHHESLRRRPR
ncbi:ROK family protein [Micromonospora sp. NPDC047134]|uniref:ROK family protein n=1 Tax=Micromonospora sp. NPDC047134 TaxID=3154340 RepID=UPI00340534BF